MSLSSQRITRAIKLIFQGIKIPFLKSFMLSVMNLKLLAGSAPALIPFCYYWWGWEPWKIKTDKHHERAFYFLTFKFCFSCGNCSNLFQLFICMINHLFINLSQNIFGQKWPTTYFDEGSEAIFCNIFTFDDTFWFHICLRFLFIFVWNFKRSGPFLSLLPVTGFITFSTLFASKEIMIRVKIAQISVQRQTRKYDPCI